MKANETGAARVAELEQKLQEGEESARNDRERLEEICQVNDGLVAQLKGLREVHEGELGTVVVEKEATTAKLAASEADAKALKAEVAELAATLEKERREATLQTDGLKQSLEKLQSDWDQAEQAAANQAALADEFHSQLSATQKQVATLEERCAQLSKVRR